MKTLRAPTLCLARRVFSALLLTLLASGAITSPTHAAKKKSENKPKRAISTTSGHKLEWEMSYGGFSYAGAGDKIAVRYPYFSQVNKSASGESPLATQICTRFFQNLPDADAGAVAGGAKIVALNPHVHLHIGSAAREKSPLLFSVGLTQELVLREKIGDTHKLLVTLCFNLLVLDFNEKEVVSAKPFQVRYLDLRKDSDGGAYAEADVHAAIRGMLTSSQKFKDGFIGTRFEKQLAAAISEVFGGGKNRGRMQVATPLGIGGTLSGYLPEGLDKSVFAELLGQELTATFGAENKVAMLPYSTDKQYTLLFIDGGNEESMKIPEPSFSLEFILASIDKSIAEKDAHKTIWAYKITGSAVIKEPFSGKIIYSAPTSIVQKKYQAATGTADEYPVISGGILRLFRQMASDINADKKTRAGALEKCRL